MGNINTNKDFNYFVLFNKMFGIHVLKLIDTS